MRFTQLIIAALITGLFAACGPVPTSNSSPSASSTPAPQASASASTAPVISSKNWTEAQITAYADCLDAQFPKDQIATQARVNLSASQSLKSRVSAEIYQQQLDGIGTVLVNTEVNRGKLLPGKPSGCEAKIGR